MVTNAKKQAQDDHRPSRHRHPVMGEAGKRDRTVDEHMFEICHPGGLRRGTCRLQLFVADGHRPVAVATGTYPGDGYSLANCAELFVAEVWRRYLPDSAQPPIWIEQQILHEDAWPGCQLVEFNSDNRYRLSSPEWTPIPDPDVEELVGLKVDLERGGGFDPPPEPTSIVEYNIRWLVAFPKPRPFREPRCMPSGSGHIERLLRQVHPLPGRQGCCWYHAGDWRSVSRMAIRLLRAARDQGIEGDEIANFVLAEADKENISGWDRGALYSLVEPTIGIFLERDGLGAMYINGQHRAQAMLDAGVRRTVTVRYDEHTPA